MSADFIAGGDRSFRIAEEAARKSSALLSSLLGDRVAAAAVTDSRCSSLVIKILRTQDRQAISEIQAMFPVRPKEESFLPERPRIEASKGVLAGMIRFSVNTSGTLLETRREEGTTGLIVGRALQPA